MSGPLRGAHRRLIVMIVALTIVPLVLLLWLGWQVLRQDRALEARQRADRVDRAADLVVAALQRAIAASEQRLAAGDAAWPDGAVTLAFRGGLVSAAPSGRLAYLPVVPVSRTAARGLEPAEELEFLRRDRRAAIAAYNALARSADPAVRGVALLRAGRNLAAAGDTSGALKAYADALAIEGAWEGGVPAGLVARYMRCRILEETGQRDALRAEAQQLARDLDSGRWPLTGAVHAVYASSAAAWAGALPEPAMPVILSEAAERLWDERLSPGRASREFMTIRGRPLTVLRQRVADATVLLVASPGFVLSQWLPPAEAVAREQAVSVALLGTDAAPLAGLSAPGGAPAGAVQVLRTSAQADLPWTVAVAGAGTLPDSGFARRRRLLIAGFAILVAMALGAGYLIVRSVARELETTRLQSDFVAAVSHEFRTPLTTLRQFTERLIEQPHLPEERRRQCYDAQSRATERLTRLVESILDFGRMEAGARRYRFRRIDGTGLVQQTVEDFRSQPEAAGREVALEGTAPQPVEADEEALSRALWNLLDNAVRYSPDGGPVDVEVARRGDHVAITVRDRGLGIPAGEQEAIFDRFRRGEQARLRGIKGTGIGLAMVREIVAAHRGRLDLESRSGEGSTFTILLPAAR